MPPLARTLRTSIVTAATIAALAANAEPIAPQKAARTSQAILSALVETNGVPGMGGAVWQDGAVVWSDAAGLRDIENHIPVDDNTVFRLASVSKVVTAVAAARLVEQGRLNIDAPVQTLVPGLSPQWPAITSRQLAAHISGIPHYQDEDDDRGGVRYATVADAVKIFKDRQLLSAPGTKYSYSSWGYTLLSAAIERAADKQFLDFLSADITRDLAIGRDATDSANPNATRAYEFNNGRVARAAPHDYSYTWAGGGLGATPRALAEFGGRLLQGALVRRETLQWMWTPAKLENGNDVADDAYRVGFGWRIATDTDGARIVHHAGVALGARSALVLWPEQSFAVSLLSNALWVSSIEQSAAMLAAPFKPTPPTLNARACPLTGTRYEGRFGDVAIRGASQFRMDDGICIGSIAGDPAMGSYFNNGPQKDLIDLRIIAIDPGTGLARAALVTPNGAYDLRAQPDGSYVASFSSKRSIVLTFR